MPASAKLFHVPALNALEMERIADETMHRYSRSNNDAKRKGRGTVIVWFRNDLRVLDNEVLFQAWCSSELVLPVYCLDPRHFATTHYFGFPKTGGKISSSFISPLSFPAPTKAEFICTSHSPI